MMVADLFAKLGLRPAKGEWAAGDRLINGIKKGLVAIAGFAAVKWAAGVIKDVSDVGGRIDDLAQQTGIARETLQELGYAAQLGGTNLEALTGGLLKFGRTIDGAARGGKNQAAALREVGLRAKDLQSGTVTLDDALGRIANKFQSMPDGPEKSALAMDLFGKSGAALIPMLNEGQAGLARVRQEARDLGIVLDEETVKELAKFGDEQDRLGASMRGMKFQIVSALLPSLQSLVKGVTRWVAANREVIKSKLLAFIEGAGRFLRFMHDALTPVVRGVHRFADAVFEAADRLGILKYVAVGAAIAVGIAWAGALLPFVLLGAAIGAVLLLVEDLAAAWNGEESFFADILRRAKELIPQLDRIEQTMIRMGMIEGVRIVGGKDADEVAMGVRAREVERGRALPVPRESPGFVSGKIAGLRDEDFDIGQQLRNQKQVTDLFLSGGAKPGASLDRRWRREMQNAMLRETGLGDVVAPFLGRGEPDDEGVRWGNRFQSQANLGQSYGELVQNTITIGDIRIDAKNADAKEVGKVVRYELEALTRSVLEASGGKAVP